MRHRLATSILCLILIGCDSKPESIEKETSIENAFSTQLDSLEKAKNVEQQLTDNAELRKQQMEERGG